MDGSSGIGNMSKDQHNYTFVKWNQENSRYFKEHITEEEEEHLRSGFADGLCCLCDDRPAGIVLAFVSDGKNTAELFHFSIMEEYLKDEVDRLLISHFLKWILTRKVTCLETWLLLPEQQIFSERILAAGFEGTREMLPIYEIPGETLKAFLDSQRNRSKSRLLPFDDNQNVKNFANLTKGEKKLVEEGPADLFFQFDKDGFRSINADLSCVFFRKETPVSVTLVRSCQSGYELMYWHGEDALSALYSLSGSLNRLEKVIKEEEILSFSAVSRISYRMMLKVEKAVGKQPFKKRFLRRFIFTDFPFIEMSSANEDHVLSRLRLYRDELTCRGITAYLMHSRAGFPVLYFYTRKDDVVAASTEYLAEGQFLTTLQTTRNDRTYSFLLPETTPIDIELFNYGISCLMDIMNADNK